MSSNITQMSDTNDHVCKYMKGRTIATTTTATEVLTVTATNMIIMNTLYIETKHRIV